MIRSCVTAIPYSPSTPESCACAPPDTLTPASSQTAVGWAASPQGNGFGSSLTPDARPRGPATLKEALRRYPPIAALMTRRTTAPITLGGVEVPKGAMLRIMPWVLHRDERWFVQANRFVPERFLDDALAIPKGVDTVWCGAARLHWPALCDARDDAAGGDAAATVPAAVAGRDGGVCAEAAGDITAGGTGNAATSAKGVDAFSLAICSPD